MWIILCSSSGTFETLMEKVLRGMKWKRTILFQDDIIIFGKDGNFCNSVKKCYKKLMLKPSKSHFFKCQFIEFLGQSGQIVEGFKKKIHCAGWCDIIFRIYLLLLMLHQRWWIYCKTSSGTHREKHFLYVEKEMYDWWDVITHLGHTIGILFCKCKRWIDTGTW